MHAHRAAFKCVELRSFIFRFTYFVARERERCLFGAALFSSFVAVGLRCFRAAWLAAAFCFVWFCLVVFVLFCLLGGPCIVSWRLAHYYVALTGLQIKRGRKLPTGHVPPVYFIAVEGGESCSLDALTPFTKSVSRNDFSHQLVISQTNS